MWGIVFAISLIATIAFLIMMVMAEKGTNMQNAGIGMFIFSFIILLISGVMWLNNRNVQALLSESK
jgi:hypothetical protein